MFEVNKTQPTSPRPVPSIRLSQASLNSKGPDKRLEKVGGLEGLAGLTAGNEHGHFPSRATNITLEN